MARRLNKRLALNLAIFIGLPLFVLVVGGYFLYYRTAGNPQAYFEAAKKQLEQGEATKAWISIRQALKEGGAKNPEIQYLAGQIALKQSPPSFPAAVQYFRNATNLKRDYFEAQRDLAELYVAARRPKEARAEIDRLLALKPDFGRAYVWAAAVEFLSAEGESQPTSRGPFYQAAVKRCQEGIRQAPDTMTLYQMLVQAYEKLEEPDKIGPVLDLAIANNPKAPEGYTLKAMRLAMQLNKPDEALKVLQQGIEKVGDSGPLYMALAEIHLRKKEADLAKDCIEKALKADPKLEMAYVRLAGLKRMENAAPEALEVLQKGLKELPDSVNLRAEIADLYLDQRQMEKADAAIAEVEKMAPGDASGLFLSGKRALLGRRAQEAVSLLQKAYDKKPTPQVRFLLGQAYNMAGEVGAAAREFANLVADMPDWPNPRRALAEAQLQLREFSKAQANAAKVLESQPNDTDMRLLLARALLAQNRRDAALAEVKKAAELAPDNPSPQLVMADLLLKEKPQEAEAAIRRAIDTKKGLEVCYQRLLDFYRATNQPDKLAKAIEEAQKALPELADQITATNPEELEKALKKRIADAKDANAGDVRRLASLYQATARPKEAEKLLEVQLDKQAPNSNEWRQTWQQLFTLELVTEDYAKAGKLVDKLKEVDPQAPEVGFASALIALSQEKIPEAAALLKQAIEQRPTSQGYFLLGQTLARQQKYDEAIAHFQKAVELKPNLVAAHLSLARVSMIRGDYAGAIVEATEAQKYAPRLVPAMELEAAAQAGQGAWNLAIDIREKIRAVAPENISNLVVLAALYRQQHSRDKSEKVFADAYQRAPDNGELVQRFAEFYVQTGLPEKATVLLEEHVKRNPDKAGAWLLRGEFAVKTSGVTEADTFYRKAAELAPDDPRPLLMLGDQYGQAKQWDAALNAYQEAGKKAKDKDVSTVDLRMADIYMLKGKGELDTAWKIVSELLRKDPKNAQAMVVGGRILARKDELAKATDLLQKAVETAPTYGEAKFRLARMTMSSDPMKALDLLGAVDPTDSAYERAMILKASIDHRRGLQKEAILDLRQLLDFRPTSQEAQTLLATLYLTVKDPARAVQVIDAMLTNRPGDLSLMVFLGDALYEKKDYREAMAQYSRARMLKPDLPTALIGEARCLVSLNRKADALKLVFDVMNRLDPKETWPRLALVSIYEMTDELPKAVETLIVGIQADPKWETGRMRLSDIFMRAKKMPEARQVLDDGLRLVPDSLPLRTDLARVELALGRAEVARQLLEPVGKKYEAERAQNPDEGERLGQYVAPLGTYSLSLYKLGKIPEAIKWAQVVWNLAPTDVANSNNLAWMLATEQKKLAEATDLVRRCLRLMPNNPQVLDTAGWIAYLRGDLEQSIELLTQSVKQGDNADARFHLGQAYQARERMEDAAEQYKESLKQGLAGKDAEKAKLELRKMGKG